MKKIIPLFLLSLFFLYIPLARAHPADVYAHTLNVTLSQSDMKIRWELKPGPMLVGFIWHDADKNGDGKISAQEESAWAKPYAALFTATLDGQSFPLDFDSILFPDDFENFQAGNDFIVLNFSAPWTQSPQAAHTLVLKNNMETKKSVNFFQITAVDDAAFLFPAQRNHTLTIDFTKDRALLADQSNLLTAWDSGAPSLPVGQKKDVVTETAEQVVPELSQRTPQDILLDFIRADTVSLPFYALALVISLALGALHALTPGHGKTVVAAYLVGSRGNAWHAIALGSIVTLTHTGSVFALGILTLTASRYFFTADLIPYLEILSGVLIVLLGGGLLIPRIRGWLDSRKKNQLAPVETIQIEDGKKRLLINQPITEDAPAHQHNGEIPRKPNIENPLAELTWRSLVTLGVSGGLVPCPDAIAILLVAVAINKILLGLMLILSFSLGLAVVLIIIGLLMVGGGRLFARMNFLSRIAPAMPIVSAGVVMILGVALTLGAAEKIRGGESNSIAESNLKLEEARVLYLFEDENDARQLYLSAAVNPDPVQITQTEKGVVDFSLSPNGAQIAYIEQTENLEYNLWMMNVDGAENTMLAPCADAVCSQPIWSPDGARIMYEYMPMDDDEYGASSLWWVDVRTKQARAVFQESRLPGTNPRWSPDGAWLSYSTVEGIRALHIESGESRLIKNALGAAAEWSPSGDSILLRDVLIADGRFITQLFAYEMQSETMTQLGADENMENVLAAWSPNGKQIAVVRRDLSIPRGDQIWVMNADGGDIRVLTDAPAVLHGSLNWSPDGKYLLYDLYLLDSVPLEARLEMFNMTTGEAFPLGLGGYSPKWVW